MLQFVKVIRRDLIEKTEEMLIVWIQDLIHKKIPLSTAVIRDQATVYHNFLTEKYGKSENFSARTGWFEKFKTIFSLHNVKFLGKFTLKQ